MEYANPYPGVLNFLEWAKDVDIEIYIISHKTKHPFLGPKYDLHYSAFEWIKKNIKYKQGDYFKNNQIYFETKKELKIEKIKELACDFFVDDLPEILLDTNFPLKTKKILFDPEGNHNANGYSTVNTWEHLKCMIEQYLEKN